MYRGYNLTVPDNFFGEYAEIGTSLHKGNKKTVLDRLEAFTDISGNLISSQMTAAWFPDVDAEVFISHAHKDSALALGLAGHLRQNYGVTSFVDSAVWGYSDKLLRMIDDSFCYNQDTATYNYQKRNRSTSHVHMMLSVALSQMINRCECIIFLNTPRSISSYDYINGMTTDSPWIYSELAMISLIEKRLPMDHRMIKSLDVTEAMASDSKLIVRYDVDLSHLHNLTAKDYNAWVNKTGSVKGTKALDMLYQMTR